MTEIVQEAKTARERLAGALGLLQSAEAGNLIESVAPPVAMAMGALHSLEVAAGRTAAETVPQALSHVQSALAALQFVPSTNPVVDDATAHVAEALGLLHGLSRIITRPAHAPSGRPDPSPQPSNHATTVISSRPSDPGDRSSPIPESELAQASTAPQPRAVAAGLDQTTLSREAPALTETDRKEREKKNAAFAATSAAPSVAPAQLAPKQAPPPSKPAPRPPGSVLVEANLGAHSDTNFFKGLSGNDVVDDGGIFIATYEIPKPGTPLWIRVTLPGGYEFEAAGAVRWTREASAGDAAPGFGAIFIELSHEARQLVYRYVRNREPLFYDDM